jgi:hypothetical protein
MVHALDPGLMRDLTEAKAALARHGIVIIRAIETDLEPALMSAAKSSMASSPGKLGKMDEDELDRFSEKLRKTSIKSAEELKQLYVRLMAKLGTDDLGDLAIELEGIEQLFKWERVAKAVQPVNELLAEKGFGPIVLEGSGDISESFELELEEKWPPAFERFKLLVDQSVVMMKEESANQGKGTPRRKVKKAQPRE